MKKIREFFRAYHTSIALIIVALSIIIAALILKRAIMVANSDISTAIFMK